MKQQKLIPNAELARRKGGKRASLNTAVYRHGHYCGIIPIKFPNGRLMWPEDEVNRLLAGEMPAPLEVGDSAARLAAGKAAAKARRLTVKSAGVETLIAGQPAKTPDPAGIDAHMARKAADKAARLAKIDPVAKAKNLSAARPAATDEVLTTAWRDL